MKLLLLLATVAVAALAQPLEEFSQADLNVWEEFKITHAKEYESTNEEAKRMLIFMDNLKAVRENNQKYETGKSTFRMKINKFADLTAKEFAAQRNGFRMPPGAVTQGSKFQKTAVNVPKTMDWRKKGAVTPIKDQGQCGSCWAFSATGSMEGAHHLATKDLVSLSEQNLVDCTFLQGNWGCDGGWMDYAFTWVKKHGIDTEDEYPYLAKRQWLCHFDKTGSAASISGWTDISTGNEDELLEAVGTVGPVSVAIDASHNSFQLYESGIYDEPFCSTTALDHGVLVVGYGATNGSEYWLVKNSWGTGWGMSGYFMLPRDKGNSCGVATKASYPVV